jgi:hypothetical protein
MAKMFSVWLFFLWDEKRWEETSWTPRPEYIWPRCFQFGYFSFGMRKDGKKPHGHHVLKKELIRFILAKRVILELKEFNEIPVI